VSRVDHFTEDDSSDAQPPAGFLLLCGSVLTGVTPSILVVRIGRVRGSDASGNYSQIQNTKVAASTIAPIDALHDAHRLVALTCSCDKAGTNSIVGVDGSFEIVGSAETVGSLVVGIGDCDGEVVGSNDGISEGTSDGSSLEEIDGSSLAEIDGSSLGEMLGVAVCSSRGASVADAVLGAFVGNMLVTLPVEPALAETVVAPAVGLEVGFGWGEPVGVGAGVAPGVGEGVGFGVGDGVGFGVGGGVEGVGGGVGANVRGVGFGVGDGLGFGVGDGVEGVGGGVGDKVGGVGLGVGDGVGFGVGDGVAGVGDGVEGVGRGVVALVGATVGLLTAISASACDAAFSKHVTGP